MKNTTIFILGFIIILFANCKNSSTKNNSETTQKSSSPLNLDAIKIGVFSQQYALTEIQQQFLNSFYNKKNNKFVWVNDLGTNNYAQNFIALLNAEEMNVKTDSIFIRQKLFKLYNSLLSNKHKFNITDTANIEFELLMTINFFDYSKRNWEGIGSEKLEKVRWFITQKKINEDDRLNLFLKNDVIKNSSFEPVYIQYSLLKKQLKKYIDIEKKGGWLISNTATNTFKKGDSSLVIASFKKELYLLEDLIVNDNTNLFNEALEIAVKKFQNRFGLLENGIIAGKTFYEMRIPIHQRIQQLLINIERSRWMPIKEKGDYLVVNIPDFKLLVYHSDTLDWSCNVVVGKSKTTSNTVIFSDSVETIVFSPYWNLPTSILLKETFPAMSSNSNYLENHNMEIVDGNKQPIAMSSIKQNEFGKNFPYNIRQKPGKNNALGLLKFLFPNDYDIYMHDSPEKSLFNESTRMFSHGCIRLEEPLKLAKFLLRRDTSWTDEKMKLLMNGEKETIVKLRNKVPVFIVYFTAWVNGSGQLNFRDDVYHHDAKMKLLLF